MGYVGQAPGKVVLSSGDITDGIIINADIASDAAIVISKTALSAGTGITLSTNTLNVDASQTQITGVGTITTGTWTATGVAVAHGGTGASTATAGFDALAPMTAAGDIIYGGASGTGTRLAKGSDTQVLTLASGAPSWATPAAGYSDAEAVAAVEGESTLVLQSGATIGGSAAATVSNKLSAFAATTSSELAGVISNETGSGALVFATSPTLVTPALGTPASGVATNLTGTAASLTAGNVTTNANLTGGVTSVGNAATVVTNANLTGHITSSGNATVLGSFTSAQLLGALTNETGSGVAVFNTSPTLITPALGTPASGVATNLTGTAASLTAGNVTTNANLTGHVTSTGNAAVLGSFTKAQLSTAVSDGTPLYSGDITIYTDAEAIAAVEGEATLVLAGQVSLAKDVKVTTTPGNGVYSGTTGTFTAGEALSVGECVYLKAADTRMWKAVSGTGGTGLITAEIMCVALAAEAISAGAAGVFLLQGFITSTAFPTYAIGETLYLPEAEQSSLNVPEGAAVDSTGDMVQVLGWASAANTIFFNPDYTIIEHA